MGSLRGRRGVDGGRVGRHWRLVVAQLRHVFQIFILLLRGVGLGHVRLVRRVLQCQQRNEIGMSHAVVDEEECTQTDRQTRTR